MCEDRSNVLLLWGTAVTYTQKQNCTKRWRCAEGDRIMQAKITKEEVRMCLGSAQ
jgi:hypothetical protein